MDFKKIDNKYKIVGHVGGGGFSEVYMVEGPEGLCALKLLKIEVKDGVLSEFKHEFEILKNMRHPNIASILDFGFDGKTGRYYYTSEFIEGSNFVSATVGQSLDEVLVRFVEVLRALEYLHSYGIYHFDIKAANVLVVEGEESHVKLIDFGLAGIDPGGRLIGTPSYMPPEIVSREPADGRADMYSLGVLFYYVLTRSNPFRAQNSQDTFARQLHFIPDPPSEVNPDIPRWMDRIVMKLLEKNPANRYSRPQEVIREINRLGEKDFPLETLTTLMSYLPEEGRFIGRKDQISLIDGVVGLFREKGEGFLGYIVTGELGAGKTRILKELKYKYQLNDIVVEFASVFDDDALDRWRDALLVHTKKGFGLRIFMIDDLQGLTGEGKKTNKFLQAVSKAKNPTSGAATLIVGASRDIDSEEFGQIRALMPETVEVKNFTEDELKAYLTSLTGISDPPSSLLDEIYTRTDGNPLFVTELLRALIDTGALFDEFGRWKQSLFEDVGVDFSKAGVPTTLGELLLESFEKQSEIVKSLLEMLAVAGVPCTPTTLGSIASIEKPHEQIIEIIRKGFVVREEGFRIRFKNALLEEAIYKSIPEEKRKSYHDELARYFNNAGDEYLELQHLAKGSNSVMAIDALKKLGNGELAVGRGKTAAEYLKCALEMVDQRDVELSVEIGLKLGEAYLICRDLGSARGEFESVEGMLSQIGESVETVKWKSDVLIRLGGTYAKLQEFDRARLVFDEAKDALGIEGTDRPKQIMIQNFIAGILLQEGRFDEARDMFRVSRDEAVNLPVEERLTITNNDLGSALMMLGENEEALEVFEGDLKNAEEGGDDLLIGRAYYNIAQLNLRLGNFEECIGSYLDCIEVCKKSGNTELMLRGYNGLGNAYQTTGDLVNSIMFYERGLALYERVGDLRGGNAISINIGIVLNAQGEPEQALSKLIPAVEFLKSLPFKNASDLFAITRGLLEIGNIERTNHSFDESSAVLTEAFELTSDEPVARPLKFWILSEMALLAGDRGNDEDLKRIMSMMKPMASRPDETQRLGELCEQFEKKETGERHMERPGDAGPYRMILEINKLIAAESDLDYVLKTVLYYALELSKAEAGAILLLDDSEELRLVCKRNMDERDDEIALSQTIARRALLQGKAVITDDALADSNFSSEASISANNLRSILCIPIRSRKKSIGVLYLDHRFQVAAFSEVDMSILEAFSDQVGLAIDSAKRLDIFAREEKKLKVELAEASRRVEKYEELIKDEMPKYDIDYGKIAGRSRAMQEILQTLEKIADTDISVFICGESGTGKELIAKALHNNHQTRKDGRYVAINCGAIPHTLIESELFGYVKGAFTGAARDKKGLIEEASGGTIFLDEISTLDLSLQVKLLRVLQERECTRIGDTKPIAVDVRVLSASNVDIEQLSRTGDFREDLYYRLCQIKIDVPPLRNRPEDLAFLAQQFVAEAAKGRGMRIASSLMRMMLDYAWPGNVRELENLIQVACALADGDAIDEKAIPKNHPILVSPMAMGDDTEKSENERRRTNDEGRTTKDERRTTNDEIMIDSLNSYDPARPWRTYEALIVAKCFKQNDYKARNAAAELGISPTTIYKRIDDFDLKDISNPLYSDDFVYTRNKALDEYIPEIFDAALRAVDGKSSDAIANLRISQGYFYKIMKKSR